MCGQWTVVAEGDETLVTLRGPSPNRSLLAGYAAFAAGHEMVAREHLAQAVATGVFASDFRTVDEALARVR